MSTAKKWGLATTIAAFGSVISFFQVNSAWADAHKFNGGWTVIGIILAAIAVFCLVKVIRNTNNSL